MANSNIVCSSLVATGGMGAIVLSWSVSVATVPGAPYPLPYLDLDHFEVWVASTNDRATATLAAETKDTKYTLAGLGYSVTRYFWVRALDKSTNDGDFYPLSPTGGVSGTTRGLLDSGDFSPGSIGLGTIDPAVVARLDWLGQGVAQQRKALEETILRVRDQSQTAQGVYDELRRSLTVQRDTDKAYYDEQIALGLAYTDAGVNAVSASLASLGLEVHDPVTGNAAIANSLNSTILTVSGQGTTLATQGILLNAISLTLGDVGTGAKFYADVQATASGFDASVGMGAYGSNGTTKGAAAIIADAKNDGTGRIRLIGDKVVLTDTGGNIYALFDAAGKFLNINRIDANVITLDKLVIGGRGITSEGIRFEYNSPATDRAAWTAGTIRYIDDTGAAASAAISSGSTATWTTGVTYIYWVKGATSLSTTSTAATAYATGNIVVATYKGGKNLAVVWGKATLDASLDLKLNSIVTDRLADYAVTRLDQDAVTALPVASSTSFTTICTLSVTAGNFPIPCGGYIDFTTNSIATTNNYDVKIVITVNSVDYFLVSQTVNSVPASTTTKIPLSGVSIPPLPAGSYIVKLQFRSGTLNPGLNHTINTCLLSAGSPLK